MFSIRRITCIALFCFGTGHSAIAETDCLAPPQTRPSKNIKLPAGVGIKEIHLFHARDQNTRNLITVCARGKGGVCERADVIMENRNQVSIVPKSSLIRTGGLGIVVDYSLYAQWEEAGRHLLLPRIDKITNDPYAYHEHYYTACKDPYPATLLDVFYSKPF